MTEPDGFRLWTEGEGFCPPGWYSEAEELAAGLVRMALAYDALGQTRSDNPLDPSVAHVERLLIPYDPQNYRVWRERLYLQSVQPEYRAVHQELAAAYRRAGDMVLGLTSRAALRQCAVDVGALLESAQHPFLREFWEKMLAIWEHYTEYADGIEGDGVEDFKKDEWAVRRRIISRESLADTLRFLEHPAPEEEVAKRFI